MGSSQKKKKEKQKDFQAKAKPTNFTDTSFKSKGIVLSQQSLSTNAPSSSSQFSHHLSLLSSKSDTQRKESLAHLTTSILSRPIDTALPQPVSAILPKLVPLLLDASNSVRAQLLKFLKSLPPADIDAHAAQLLPYIRAGMTHLAADIRLSAVEVLGWLVDTAGSEIVACAGGWIKTLNCFLSLLGWHTEESAKWSSNRSSFGKAGSEGRPMVKALQVLAEFLRAGIGKEEEETDTDELQNNHILSDQLYFPLDLSVQQNMIPNRPAPYAYLNLFGQPRDAESEMYESREDRLRVFADKFRRAVERGVENARKEGGEVGRASAGVSKVLRDAGPVSVMA
ncbi:putative rRNA processing protein Ipi1 [Talaromyces proteolyticus]|uniref:Pre-rRNA-processing protein n=1 Tax=Talaromyces proteolyticus TaxID=1131652 RepID=A0AAD4PRR5_9EURO|nr:putative rRNA processing protein Ipi1 [Talaromyces proteolyticus]KAH8689564.1 putative rRNA processing protein Ipi1 [Talaromyces proteolyticus]